MVKKIIKILAFVLFIIFLIYTKLFVNQYQEFKRGEESFKKQNFKDAVVYYETVIQYYTPVSPYIEDSIRRMFEIADIYEKTGKFVYALDVYENLRSVLYATKSFYQPHRNVISICDQKISKLSGMLNQ